MFKMHYNKSWCIIVFILGLAENFIEPKLIQAHRHHHTANHRFNRRHSSIYVPGHPFRHHHHHHSNDNDQNMMKNLDGNRDPQRTLNQQNNYHSNLNVTNVKVISDASTHHKNVENNLDITEQEYALQEKINNVETSDNRIDLYIPGTITEQKFQKLGTALAVKESRNNFVTKQLLQQSKQEQKKQQKKYKTQLKDYAMAHANRIYAEGSCRWPKPKVISVQADPSKTYIPHCTVLHRCSDDTGCCFTETRSCVAKLSHEVDLYFYVFTLGNEKGQVEKQTFVNHTECMCIDKHQRNIVLSAPAQLRQISMSPSPLTSSSPIFKCTCPNLYEKVIRKDGNCECDCLSGNVGCEWMKRGEEHFSIVDRKCIITGRCKLPRCEYGAYNRRIGRCPRKEYKLASVGFSFE